MGNQVTTSDVSDSGESGDYEEGEGLTPAEIEVRLAIADYVIRRVNGTPEGLQIFNALIPRFDNRYPQHKLLAHCLTSPGFIEFDETLGD